jgi:hypothetical protein
MRTDESEVIGSAVLVIAVNMIDLKRDLPSYRISLMPSTERTLFTISFYQVTLNVTRASFTQLCKRFKDILEPTSGFEPLTPSLPWKCSTN